MVLLDTPAPVCVCYATSTRETGCAHGDTDPKELAHVIEGTAKA